MKAAGLLLPILGCIAYAVSAAEPSARTSANAAARADDANASACVGCHGAKGAGLLAVLRPNESVPPYDVEPDAVIDRLSDLLGVAERFNATTRWR